VGHVLLDVDSRLAVVAENQNFTAQTQVYAGRLQEAVVPRFEDQAPGLDLFTDAVIAED
jgi:hypothetical protein